MADRIDAHVGARVRLRRTALGVSQEELGDALGLTFQQVQKYERGQNRIAAGRLYRIAQYLSVPVDWFYDGLPPPAQPCAEAEEQREEINSFLTSPEGHALSRSFQMIGDIRTRRRIVDLVATIASEKAPG